MTSGYWYADVQYWVYNCTWGDITVDPNELGVVNDPKLPSFVASGLKYLSGCYDIVPFYGLIWSIGLYVWALFAALALTILKKRSILPFLPPIALWLSLLVASPVYAEFRYAYPIIITVPFLCAVSLFDAKEKPLSGGAA